MNFPSAAKVHRNEICPCGSGKKYKHCCLLTGAPNSSIKSINTQLLLQSAHQAASQGNFALAESMFRKLVGIKANDASALAGLGQALCWLHRRREGLGYLQKAARILEKKAEKPGNSKFLVELSGQLLHWGDIRTAERLARLAVRLEPRSAVALNNLVLCLTRVNRNAEALPISRRVCELLPDEPGCNILLAMIESRLGHKAESRRRLTHVIESDRNQEQTARAYLELANLLDNMADYSGAFAALSEAAAAHAQFAMKTGISRDHLFSTLATNKAGFTSELLQRWPIDLLAEDGLPAPVFLVGFLRSGTTLTEQILATHPDVIATDESGIIHELTIELSSISSIPNNTAAALKTINAEQIHHLRRFFWDRMREEYGDGVMQKVVVDKNALNAIELGLISVVFPEAKILFALRDPRDICISCFMQAFSLTPATVNLLTWDGIAKQYEAVMDYWLYLKCRIQPQFMELRYEDTISDFETCYRNVFHFLSIKWTPEIIRFHERAQGRFISTPSFSSVSQPLYKTAVARWKNYEPYYQPILPRLGRFIEAFGYLSV